MRKRLGNIWYYYKWYILCGFLVLAVIIDFGWKKIHTIAPDYQIAVVETEYMQEKDKDEAAKFLSQYIKDKNGDGKKKMEIYQYRYDGDTQKTLNADEFMASAVQLAVDMKEKVSLWYVTDCPEILMEADPKLQKLGYWKDIFMNGKETDIWGNLTVLSRDKEGQKLWNTVLDKNKKERAKNGKICIGCGYRKWLRKADIAFAERKNCSNSRV